MTKNDRIAQITLPYVALPSYRDDCPRFCEMFKALPLSVVRDMTNKVGGWVESGIPSRTFQESSGCLHCVLLEVWFHEV